MINFKSMAIGGGIAAVLVGGGMTSIIKSERNEYIRALAPANALENAVLMHEFGIGLSDDKKLFGTDFRSKLKRHFALEIEKLPYCQENFTADHCRAPHFTLYMTPQPSDGVSSRNTGALKARFEEIVTVKACASTDGGCFREAANEVVTEYASGRIERVSLKL